MSMSQKIKNRRLKLVVSLAIILALLGGAKLGSNAISVHATSPGYHFLACGGGIGFPPCD